MAWWWPLAAAVGWGMLVWLTARRAEERSRRLWEQYSPRIPPLAEVTRATLAEWAVNRAFFVYHLPAIVVFAGAAQPEPGTTWRWFAAVVIGTTGLAYAGLLAVLS